MTSISAPRCSGCSTRASLVELTRSQNSTVAFGCVTSCAGRWSEAPSLASAGAREKALCATARTLPSLRLAAPSRLRNIHPPTAQSLHHELLLDSTPPLAPRSHRQTLPSATHLDCDGPADGKPAS
eukprot:scaffold3678_cov355-Prasinococcus_capsulatus_cf.AAC.9